jgi:hypothetical protein
MSIKQTVATAAVSAFATWVGMMVWLNPITQPVNRAVALASHQVLMGAGCLDDAGRMSAACPAEVRKQASDARKRARRVFQTMVPSLINQAAEIAVNVSSPASPGCFVTGPI